jgi:multicomponent Na+:H+ antiporter subunit E
LEALAGAEGTAKNDQETTERQTEEKPRRTGSGGNIRLPMGQRLRKMGGMLMRYVSLAGFLFVFWLALSGHYTPMLITAGAVSAVLCTWVAVRMRTADDEGHPVELFKGAVTYIPWLIYEIFKAGWAVTKIVLHPRLPISPTMTVVRASQKTNAGIATYANSITLTPGTITVGVSGNDLTIHALAREGAIDLEGGGMDQRVSRFEGTA